MEKLKTLGFDPSLFLGAITSGELTHQYLQRLTDHHISINLYCIAIVNYHHLFQSLPLHMMSFLQRKDFSLHCQSISSCETALASTHYL